MSLPNASAACSMNGGRFSASSFAGTSTETSTTGARCWEVGVRVRGLVTGSTLDPLSHTRRQHAELVAVLRDRAPRDLDAILLENVHDRLVGERVLRVLVRDELLDLRLDAP